MSDNMSSERSDWSALKRFLWWLGNDWWAGYLTAMLGFLLGTALANGWL